MGTTARDIGYTRHEGRRGFLWLRESYAMFARHRGAWIMLLLAYYAMLLLVQALPWVGAVVAPLLKPLLSVGFLAAAWTQERGGKPAISMLLRGFRANPRALLPLGFVFVAGISIALTATALVDGGQLLDALYGAGSSADDNPDAATRAFVTTLQSPRVMAAIAFGALCALPTLLALWWAPALVVFQDAGPFTALGASIRAAVGNWRATLRYAMAIVVFGVVIPTSISAMLALALPPPISQTAAALIVLPYVAFFVATLHISDYVSYRDVFHAGEKATVK